MTNRLQWDLLVSAQIPVVASDLPPGASEMKWSPISSTLISGKRDAVLVDTAITVDQNKTLVDWIAHDSSAPWHTRRALSLRTETLIGAPVRSSRLVQC